MQELWQDMEEGSHCLHHGPNVRGGWGGVGWGWGGGGVWFGTAGLSILTSQLSISDLPGLPTVQTQVERRGQ